MEPVGPDPSGVSDEPADLPPAWVEPLVAVLLLLAAAAAAWRVVRAGDGWSLAEIGLLIAVAGLALARPVWFAIAVLGCLALGGGALGAVTARGGRQLADLTTVIEVSALLLAAAGVTALVRARLLAAEDRVHEALLATHEYAVIDQLTGTSNRRGLDLAGQPMLENARREGQAVHCLLVDVDGLRSVNDDAGRRAGDAVLVTVAEALRIATRSTDVVARWDGDAFVVLGPGTGVSPLEMERRVRAHLSAASVVPRQQWPGRVSAGSATLVPWDEGDLDSLLQRAEQDMSLRRALRRRSAPGQPTPDPAGRTIMASTDDQ